MEVLKYYGIFVLGNRELKEGDAVMFDIDDTLVRVNDEPIKEMVELLQSSKMLGYKIVIITARMLESSIVEYTKTQLLKHGIFPDVLCFVPPQEKGKMKRKLKKRYGINTILSVGDLPTDLTDSPYWLNTSTFCYN
jgi:hypothetical protein